MPGARVGTAGMQEHERLTLTWTSHQVLTSPTVV